MTINPPPRPGDLSWSVPFVEEALATDISASFPRVSIARRLSSEDRAKIAELGIEAFSRRSNEVLLRIDRSEQDSVSSS